MKSFQFLIFLVFFISCKNSPSKVIDFNSFHIKVPKDWIKYELKGIDSYVGGIITDKNDTLKFDLGMYSGDVSENSFPMVYDSISLSELNQKEKELLPKTKHLIVKNYDGNINYKEYQKYNTSYDSIDCFKVKFIEPSNKGFGVTGIFIDNLKPDNEYRVKFNFYGHHLSDSIQTQFLKALRTIKFKKYCIN